jgi:hypothetical protein
MTSTRSQVWAFESILELTSRARVDLIAYGRRLEQARRALAKRCDRSQHVSWSRQNPGQAGPLRRLWCVMARLPCFVIRAEDEQTRYVLPACRYMSSEIKQAAIVSLHADGRPRYHEEAIRAGISSSSISPTSVRQGFKPGRQVPLGSSSTM